MKKTLLLALIPLLSGCGLLFVNGPPSGWQEIQDPDQLETMAITQPCTTGKSVLLLDVAGTVIYGTTWGVFVSDQSDPMPLAERIMLPLLIPVGAHLFSAPFLHQLIRNREGILGEFFTDFVPKMLDAYLETQYSVRQQMENFSVPTNWMDPTGKMKMPIFDPFGAFKKKTGETSESSDPVNKNRDEVDELRMKLKELEERLNSIKS